MNLNKYIDHTLLKPDATSKDIVKLCNEAIDYDFYSVCVNSSYVSLAKSCLKDTPIKIAAVCGFPLGMMETSAKAYEADMAMMQGADEIDMVINIGRLKDKDFEYISDEIEAVADIVHDYDGILKVIIETCMLTDEEKVKACQLAVKANADFVKTSTGFSSGGATVSDVKLMAETVGSFAEVKASGGIRDRETAIAMINAGATRLGVSASIKIIEDN